ncbi:MAG: glycosyl hydrolase family 17 protein [Flavobacteriaceae bacterium]
MKVPFLKKMQSPITVLLLVLCFGFACNDGPKQKEKKPITAEMILGNPNYPALSYGGYRGTTREEQPTLNQLKNDLHILHAMGIRLLRTYNLQFDHTPNLLKAIKELQQEDPSFEMYVMLGAWIDCKDAWTASPIHNEENLENNQSEIEKAVLLANQYPGIVKIIAVGNEAMVHWAAAYFVTPNIILKWVSHLQELKEQGKLPKELWITSSDNFASWGGGDSSYHLNSLTQLIKAVDYLSIHTYPFHDTHYNPDFWRKVLKEEMTKEKQIEMGMDRAIAYSIEQYQAVKKYLDSLGVQKPIHIGETGWATKSKGLYGNNGSQAADEFKQALYYKKTLEWTQKENITAVYFSAFDEPWKDPNGPEASENNFGLFTVDGKAKYALWSLVEQGLFNGLSRDINGRPIVKTFEGDKASLMEQTKPPKSKQ